MRWIVLFLVATSACAQPGDFLQGLEARFAQSAPRGGNTSVSPAFQQERLRDLNSFNSWFDRSYLPAFQAQPGWTPQRRAFVGRALAYLGAVGGLAGADPGLNLALSAAFNRLGRMQEIDPRFLDREGAILSYQNSALILNQLASRNPHDPQLRGELDYVSGRMNALGGSVPIWMTFPPGGYRGQPEEPRGIPEADRSVAVRAAVPGMADYPRLDEAALTEAERSEWRELRQRYLNVLATVYAARNAVAPVQASVESRGFGVTPELARSSTRMQLSLEVAKTDLEEKQFASARENLQIAEGEARKILSYVGR